MTDTEIKACVESFERHLDGAVKIGELRASTDQKYITDLMAEVLKAQAGDRQPALPETGSAKGVGISDLLDANRGTHYAGCPALEGKPVCTCGGRCG
jgi:hypothetical protein